ncbi:RICIN domain-containing protein [Kitasatospora sp. NPDC057223]|uniref:RICIN domain-containing protein n=1 Tax=Kitasatospora sp. NPDC057223 TaxID=3346055 RepID=UPI003637301F
MQRVLNRMVLVLGLLTALLGGVGAGTASAAAPVVRITNNLTGGSLMPQDYGANSNDGIAVYAWDPSDTRGADLWRVEFTTDGYNVIRNIRTGKCLKPGGNFEGETFLSQGTCSTSLEFLWSLKHRVTDDTYKIKSVSSGQVLAPYEVDLNQVVVLEADTNIAKNWWSVDEI